MIEGTTLRSEMAARVQAMSCGGIGLIPEMVRAIGLAERIDARVHVFNDTFPTTSRIMC